MTPASKKKSAICALSIFLIVLLLTAGFTLNFFRLQHNVFDSQKWKTDITSRYDMPKPAQPGMQKAEILKLLGKPDGVGSNENSEGLIYLMPSGSKGVYCVYFKNDIVVDTRYDDSADDSYPEH